MKRLTTIGFCALLAMGSGAALADRDYRGGKGDGHGNGHGKGHGYHDERHNYKHYGGHHDTHYVYYYPRPYYPRYPDRYVYYPLGAALIGSAVTYSLYHSHDGVRCYDNHSVSSYSSPSSEVVGCHRIERYPDGSERRVDLPLSECY